MEFEVLTNVAICIGKLAYEPNGYSFEFMNRLCNREQSGSSLLVKDLELELDVDSCVLFPCGYCPHATWRKAHLAFPSSSQAVLRVKQGMDEQVPGICKRLEGSERWEIHFDETNNCVCIGDTSSAGHYNFVEFATGCVAALEQGRLKGLWLRFDRTTNNDNCQTHAIRRTDQILPRSVNYGTDC